MEKIFDMSNEEIQKRIDNNIENFKLLANSKPMYFTKSVQDRQDEREHEQKAILLGYIFRDLYVIKGFFEARDIINHLNDMWIKRILDAYGKLWEEKVSEK